MGFKEWVNNSIDLFKYRSWEARQYPKGPKTHYEKGYIPEAMKILAENRNNISEAIFDYCNAINDLDFKHPLRKLVISSLWDRALAEKLIKPFIRDNKTFSESKIRNNYPDPARFFSSLSILTAHSGYPNRLKMIKAISIKPNDINNGWTALLREFGIFFPSNELFCEMTINILNNKETSKLNSDNILDIVDDILNRLIFVSDSGIHCPAANQVRNHFGLCIGLNLGLIKAGIYSSETRISMLKADESNHFRSPESMIEEYNEKIKLIS